MLLSEYILHGVYSAFDTLFPSLLITLDHIDGKIRPMVTVDTNLLAIIK